MAFNIEGGNRALEVGPKAAEMIGFAHIGLNHHFIMNGESAVIRNGGMAHFGSATEAQNRLNEMRREGKGAGYEVKFVNRNDRYLDPAVGWLTHGVNDGTHQ